MNDTKKSKLQLIDELNVLRTRTSELKDSELKLKKLVEQSRDGIVILDSNGKVYDANQKYAEMLGYTLEETHQLHVWDWDKTVSRETVLKLADSVDEKGHHFESIHTRKDGSIYNVELSNSGTVVGGKKLIFCICRDITDRKRNETQLREIKEQLTTFIDNFQGIAYQASVHETESYNPQLFRGAVKQITGYSSEELSSLKAWYAIIHPDDLEQLQKTQKRFADFPEYISEIEYRIIRKDGAQRWVKDNAQLVTIGANNLIHGTIFDITRQKNAEEEKLKLEEQIRHSRKLEAIGTLAGGVAHDFNNILSIIMGYTDHILFCSSEESSGYQHLLQIKKASNRAKDIIQQLLTFSRKVNAKKEPLDVVPVISEVLTFLHSTLPSTISLQHHLDIDDGMILADPTQIHQVIMNLCVNAAQAIENRKGIITVKVSVEHYAKDPDGEFTDLPEGNYVKISVTDNGPGIDPKITDRIFDPYFTTREKGKGSGMGLAVVHGIVKNHGGAICLNSKPGNTTFTFVIPAVKWKQKIDTPIKSTTPSGAESILFIDDEEDITVIGKLILEDHGFRVHSEVNPLDALDHFKKNPLAFDAIVTDMTMPHLTGEALFHEARKIRANIPVILFTGHSEYINEKKALELGITAFMHKPLHAEELIRIIHDAIDNHRCVSSS